MNTPAKKNADCPRCQTTVNVRIVNDQLAVCGRCGEPLPEVAVPQLSGKAQFSLLLALLSFVLSIFAAVPAIVLAWLAIGEIRRAPDLFYGERSAKRAIWLSTIGSLVTLGGLVWLGEGFGFYRIQQAILVSDDAEWRWIHPAAGVPDSVGDDFFQTFANANYDDSHWERARDQSADRLGFGYGDPVSIDIGTPPENQRGNAYFRHHFSAGRPVHGLLLSMVRDDGIVVYLDGLEVLRDNVPPGELTHDTHAIQPTPNEAETRHYALDRSLDVGQHVLTIALINRGRQSSDLRLGRVQLAGRVVGK